MTEITAKGEGICWLWTVNVCLCDMWKRLSLSHWTHQPQQTLSKPVMTIKPGAVHRLPRLTDVACKYTDVTTWLTACNISQHLCTYKFVKLSNIFGFGQMFNIVWSIYRRMRYIRTKLLLLKCIYAKACSRSLKTKSIMVTELCQLF